MPRLLAYACSTYAVGGLAGVVAAFPWLFTLALAEGPDPGWSSLVVLSPIAGLLYVQLTWWLPASLAWRSLLFGVVMAATFGAVAAAVPGSVEREATMAIAFGIGATIPIATRAVVWAFASAVVSVMALRPGQSLPMLFLVSVIVISTSGALPEAIRSAPIPFWVSISALAGLAVAVWTVGQRPPDDRPTWFRAIGPLLVAAAMAAGILSLLG